MFEKLVEWFAMAFSALLFFLGVMYIVALMLIPFGILWGGYQIITWLITK